MRIAKGLGIRLALAGMTLLSGALYGQVNTSVSSGSLNFAHQTGTTAPPAQVVRVYSTPQNLAFTATAQTDAPATGWLLVNGQQSATGTTGLIAGQEISISVSTTGLAAGAYTGRVIVSVAGGTPTPINVTLTVTANAQIRIDPASVTATLASGENRAVTLAVNSTTASTPVAYNATVTGLYPASSWISVFPNTGNTGTSATLLINTAGLPQGVAIATVNFTSITSPSASVSVPVALVIGAAADLTVTPANISFGFQRNGALPTPKSATITSTTASQIAYTASVTSGAWLSLSNSPSGPGTTTINLTTPAPLYLIANPAAIGGTAPGNYDAVVTISAPNIAAKTINARLVISDSTLLTTSLDAVTFNHTLGGVAPTATALTINTTGTPVPFTITPSTTEGGDWLRVTPQIGNTPTQLTVSINPERLPQLGAGTYPGMIRVTAAGVANSPLDIPVTLTVSGSALITVEPASLSFNAIQGQTPPAQSFAVRSTDNSNQPFTIGIEPANTAWLIPDRLNGQTGTTGTLVQVIADPSRVTGGGTYDAAIVITPTAIPGAAPFRVPVRLTVTGSTTITATPTQLTFSQPGTTAPAPQTITLNSSVAGLSYIASALSSPWLGISPSSGPFPATLSITVNSSGLQPGEYKGEILISGQGFQSLTIPVVYRYQSSTITATPTELTFAADAGGAAPANQTINLSSSGAATAFTAAAATTTGGSWLSVTPTSGNTTAVGGAATPLQVAVNTQSLAAGSYQGTITITPQGGTPITISVALTVRPAVLPSGLTVVNAASGVSRGVSPGQIIVITGRNMAPTTATPGRIVENVVTTSVGDVRVTFDGVAAPLLYVGPSGDRSSDQINAVVPYGIAGRQNSQLVVEYRSQRSAPLDLRVVETDPGLFTQTQTGSGAAAIRNQDNSVNLQNNAAARGSIIQIYATGEGQVTPAGVDGRVIQANELRRPLANVVVRIGGQTAEVVYAGSVGAGVSGAFQINARIPQNLNITTAGTAVPIEVQVGQNVSQPGTTVFVRP